MVVLFINGHAARQLIIWTSMLIYCLICFFTINLNYFSYIKQQK